MMFKAYGVDSVVITTQNILWVNYGSREGWINPRSCWCRLTHTGVFWSGIWNGLLAGYVMRASFLQPRPTRTEK